MNQPYDPNNPYSGYGDPQGQGSYGHPNYGQPDYRQPGYEQSSYGQPNQYGYDQQPPPQPPKSKLPIFIAAGLVVVLAVGVTLFLALRDPSTTAGGGGGEPAKQSAVEVTKQFFEAIDAVDEDGMKSVARGDMLDDIKEIIADGGTDLFSFADGELVDDGSKQVDEVEIALVVWQLEDDPGAYGDLEFSVGLLDDGGGFKVCYIDAPDSGGIDAALDDWEDEFAEHCGYKK